MQKRLLEFNGLWNEESYRNWFAVSVLKTEDPKPKTRWGDEV
ncbi:MAG: hypothetical protein ABIJ10_05975 [Candidatus Micrarchaeota archaeon]